MGRYNFEQHTRDGYVVTPALAKQWLEKNTNNRNVNFAKVKKMAKDMREGHWDTTHQGIAIATDGTLVDGQHRLMAVVESGVTVRMNVDLQCAQVSAHRFRQQPLDGEPCPDVRLRHELDRQNNSLGSQPYRPYVFRLQFKP